MWRPWKSETDVFLDLLRRSGLLDKTGIRKARRDVRVDAAGKTKLDKLCSHLVATNILTEWQCIKLREGKYKGFFLDNYRIMGHLSIEETTSTYLAEDVTTGKRVALAVTPPNLVPHLNGKIQYSVTEVLED